MNNSQIRVPSLVRIKPGALPRLGTYLSRSGFTDVLVVSGQLPEAVTQMARQGLENNRIHTGPWVEVDDNSFENVVELFALLPKKTMAIVGLGGGKALDMAKYLAFLARLPYLAVPTSLSNDGFCSPQSSLTMHSKRRSLAATLPQGVIIDVDVCLSAPRALWLSGVGDLVAKLTAVHDWKLSFHNTGEPVNDLAAVVDFGPHGAWHGHNDKLNMIFYAYGEAGMQVYRTLRNAQDKQNTMLKNHSGGGGEVHGQGGLQKPTGAP